MRTMLKLFTICFFCATSAAFAESALKPDIVVAADGSGDFKTVQQAVSSVPMTNRERIVIFIKNGVYNEKVRVDAPFVTLRGESRDGTRIEFAQLNEDFARAPDNLGRAVINLSDTANDFVLEHLTVENTAGVIGPHAFAIYGRGDRTVIVDCDVLSHGADTLSLWRGDSGRYYHARCRIRGSVDFVCPRGWCYMTDCDIYEMKNTAAVWHDGSKDKDMKFVMRNCRFDGTNGWNLARHHHDAQFYFLSCTFSKTMIDRAPFRVIYPLGTNAATDADIKRNKDLDASNIWGERSYFFNCHRGGGDFPWMKDNLSTAAGSPSPEDITAAWTFAGKWNPEATNGPKIVSTTAQDGQIVLSFSEPVTVKGKPILKLRDGGTAGYASGGGSDQLIFKPDIADRTVERVDLNGGAILASEASASIRWADLALQ